MACLIMPLKDYAYKVPVDEISKNSVKVIENKGQWDPQVLFRAQIPGGALFITKNSFVYSFTDQKALHDLAHDHNYSNGNIIKRHNYKVTFDGANANPSVLKYEPSQEYYNYFLGSDESKWANGCRAYGKIVLQNLYDGIDMELIALDERIKVNFIVKPYANPSSIRMNYDGPSSIKLINEYVMVETSVAAIKEDVPVSSQPDISDVNIETHYQLDQNTLSFHVGAYNHAFPLVIDPQLIFSTYSGSTGDNWGFTATYDTLGYGYSGGTVYNEHFPVTTGAYQTLFNDGVDGGVSEDLPRDCGILKYKPDGTGLIYATYLGGHSNEQPHSMVCDHLGNLIVMGATWSNDFPVLSNAYDRTHNGNADIFVTKFAPDGRSLLGSTYIGGTMNDGINGTLVDRFDGTLNPLAYNYGDFFRGEVNVDYANYIYVATSTNSDNFPVVNGFQNTLNGDQDGCVIKFYHDLTRVSFSTYIGGSGFDAAYGVVTDATQKVFICGGTTSSNIGPTSGTFSHHGREDGFVAQISPTGGILNRYLHIGTNRYDQAYLIQLDDNTGNIYIAGQTEGNIPSKGNVYKVDNAKQFIMSFNHNLDSIILSSTFGLASSSFPELSPSSFLVDFCGRVYFSGWGGDVNTLIYHSDLTYPIGLTTTSNALLQSTTDGSDFYLVVFSPNLTGIDYATYFGDSHSADHVDGGTSRFDKHAIVYQSVCAGCGGSSSFPTFPNPGAWSNVNNGRTKWGFPNCNNALFKIDMNVSTHPPDVRDTVLTITATDTLKYTFQVTHPDGDSVFTVLSGSVMSQTPNTPKINKLVYRSSNVITITWPTLCTNRDTFELIVDASDHNCTPHSRKAKIKIAVTPMPKINEPYPSCIANIDDSTAKFDWLPVAKSKYFKTYKIYRKHANSNSQLIASLPYSDSIFVDTTAYNHLFENYCYYITSVNNCNVESTPSRITCTLYEEDTASSPAFYFTHDTILYVYPTDTVDYTTTFFTANPGDSISLVASGSMIQQGQGHLFDITEEVRGKGQAAFQFKWEPGCSDITTTDTASIKIFILNNQCPTPRKQFAYIKIVVLPPPPGPAPVLKCIHRRKGSPVVDINWTPVATNKYFSHFVLIRKDAAGNYTQLAEVSDNGSYTTTDNAPNNDVQDYCYAAYPVTICNTIGDTGDFQCTVTRKDENVPGVYIYTVTVEDNKKILVAWRSSDLTNFESYSIYKRVKGTAGSTYAQLGTPMTDTTFTDDAVKVMSDVYCYQIRQTNTCGIESKADGKEACSIVLKGKSKPFEHKLGWTPYDYWTVGTDRYDIERTEPDLSPVVTGWAGKSDTAWNDEHLNKDNGLYYYTIVAYEGVGGYGYTSRSNTIELIQAPLLHVPNAFTPNGDGLNDKWEPDPVFVKDYNLKIYNRWGQLIFETNNKHETFNATFLNDPSSTDAYVYLITYTGWDSSTHVQKGNVTILR